MAGWKKAAAIAVVAAAVLCVAVWQLQPSLEPEAEPAEPPLIYVESTGEEVTPVERTVGEGIEREMLPVVTLTAAEDSLFLYVPEQFQDTVQVEEEYYHQIGQGQLEILREMRQLLPLADGGWRMEAAAPAQRGCRREGVLHDPVRQHAVFRPAGGLPRALMRRRNEKTAYAGDAPNEASFFLKQKWKARLTFLQARAIIQIWKVNFTYERRGSRLKNRLEELRKSRGVRQEELADALGVSRQTIGSLENGRYNPSILLAFKIARYFGMTIEDIFIYEEESK